MTNNTNIIEKNTPQEMATTETSASKILSNNNFKAIVHSKELVRALSHMRNITDKNSVMEWLSDIKLVVRDNYITIEATDVDVYLFQKIGATAVEAGEIRVDSETFDGIMKTISDETVEIYKKQDSNNMEIVGKNCHFLVPALPAIKFPQMENIEQETSISISANQLLKIINYTQYAVSRDETRYSLNGLYFHIKDNKLYSAATDAHRLSVAGSSETLEINSNADFGIILPQKTIEKLKKILTNDSTKINITLGTQKIEFNFNNGKTILISKIIDGKFPSYESFIPKHNNNKLKVNRQLFEQIVIRISSVNESKFKAVKLTIKDSCLEIHAASNTKGEAVEILPFSTASNNLCAYERIAEGEEEQIQKNNLAIGCNPEYLLDILKNLKGEYIELSFNDDPLSPVLIKENDNIDDNFVIMPVKV